MRHHYAVTVRRPDGSEERWFHTFAEAESSVEEHVAGARQAGQAVADHGYWRKRLGSAGSEAATELSLDDAGLRACGPLCGAG